MPRGGPQLSNGGFGLKIGSFLGKLWRCMFWGVSIFTKLAVSLSKMDRFSIRNHRWKAKNEPYQLTKAWE